MGKKETNDPTIIEVKKNGQVIGYKKKAYLGRKPDGNKVVTKVITAPTKALLQEYIRQAQIDYQDQKDKLTFKQATLNLMDKKRNRKKPVSPATINNYKYTLKAIESRMPEFLQIDINSMTSKDLEELHTKLGEDGLSIGSVNAIFTQVKMVLKDNEIQIKMPELETYEPSWKDTDIPDEETMNKILELAKGTELYIPIFLATYGPLRKGEVCALSLDDIDGNVIHIRHTMVLDTDHNNEYVIKDPKTKESIRDIAFPSSLISMIKKQGYITKQTPDQLYKSWSRFLKRNNLPHYKFHALRHYGTTYFLDEGYDTKDIQIRGGWKNTQVMMSVYNHYTKKRKTNFNNIMANYLESKMK